MEADCLTAARPCPAVWRREVEDQLRAVIAPLAITLIAGTTFAGVMLSSLGPRTGRRTSEAERAERAGHAADGLQIRFLDRHAVVADHAFYFVLFVELGLGLDLEPA